MPNTREKLIELLKDTRNNAAWHHWGYEESADHLIANGVSFQEESHWATEQAFKNGYEKGKPKWIPVTERLPDDDSDVLAYLRIGEEGRIYPANYAKGMWFDCIFNTPATENTTHWMPLPEPPKGE